MSMKNRRTGGKKARPSDSGPRVRRILFAILLVAAWLRLWRIDSVIGGFHDHNEANYTLIAMNLSPSTLLLPNPGDHVFLESPPFYAYVLAAVFELTGVSVLTARLVSVAASLGLIIVTFLMGRRLFGDGAGLAAAALVAVSPVAVLTGRNIQTDSLFVFLLVAALLVYLRLRSGSQGNWLWFGLLFGLAIFTKLFAVIALATLVLWELVANRDWRGLVHRRFGLALAVMAAIPLVFYGYHAVRDFSYLQREVTGGAAAATRFPTSISEWSAWTIEVLWALSPIVALLILAGLVAAVFNRSRETLFVLLPMCGFSVFYLLVHKHSYYLLAVLPFGALLAGRFVSGLTSRGLRIGLLAAATTTGIVVSLVDLTSMKFGFTEFAEFGRLAANLPGPTHPLLITDEVLKSHGTALTFYDSRARLVTIEALPRGPDGRVSLPEGDPPYLLSFVSPQVRDLPSGWLLGRERYGLELFGWTFAEAHPNPHFFRQGAYIRTRTGGPLDFGLRSLRSYPAMAMIPIQPGVGLYQTAQGLALRPIGAPQRID